MKRKSLCFWTPLLLMAALIWVGCPTSGGDDDGKDDDTRTDITKKSVNGNPVFNYLYVEVNDTDPRVAMGYVLEDSGKPFFDNVILFAANMRDRNCLLETSDTSHNCTKTGLHLHFNGNVQHILDNRDTYIKPLQDKGIKVSLGLLGDWGGVTFGTLGGWPLGPRDDESPYAINNELEDNAELNSNSTSGGNYATRNGYSVSRWGENGYPYGPNARDEFLQQVKAALDQYGLDGIDLDDEWGSKDIYAGGYVYPKTSGTLWYDGGSKNVYRYYGSNTNKVYAALVDGAHIYAGVAIKAREILGPDKLITFYEWNYGRPNPKFDTDTISYNGSTVRLQDYVNFVGEAAYGSFVNDSYYGVPNAKYAPVGIDLGGGDSSRVRPAMTGTNPVITANMASHLNFNYGANLFYCLLARERYSSHSKLTNQKGDELDLKDIFYDSVATNEAGSGQGNMPEVYLSMISSVIYGEKVVYEGADYQQDWEKK